MDRNDFGNQNKSYCPHCGQKLSYKDTVCPFCGENLCRNATSGMPFYENGNNAPRNKSLVCGVIGLLFALFIPYAGIIFGTLAIVFGKEEKNAVSVGLGITALLLSVVGFVFSILYLRG